MKTRSGRTRPHLPVNPRPLLRSSARRAARSEANTPSVDRTIAARSQTPLTASSMIRYDFNNDSIASPTHLTAGRAQHRPEPDVRPLTVHTLTAALNELKNDIECRFNDRLTAAIARKADSNAETVSRPPIQTNDSARASTVRPNIQTASEQSMPKTHAILCEKFSGSSSSMTVNEWLDLFNAGTIDWSDRDRLRALPRHLADESISWFSLEVAPDIQSIEWPEVQRRMIARFGHALADPSLLALNRKLSFKETVTKYYNDKRRLLIRAGAPLPMQISYLTVGMPDWYQKLFASQRINTTEEWLEIALRLELMNSSHRFSKPTESTHFAEESDHKPRNKRHDNRFKIKGKRSDRSDLPSTPCPECIKHGINDE